MRRLRPAALAATTAISVAIVAACSSTPAPVAAPASAEVISRARAEAQALQREAAEAQWALLTGAPPPATGDHAWLLDRDTLASLAETASRATGDEQRDLMRLHAFLVRERVRHALATHASALRAAEREAIETPAGAVTLAELGAWLAREPDRGRREVALHAAALANEKHEPHRAAMVQALAALAGELGFADAGALLAHAWLFDAPAARELASRTLTVSEGLYLAALGDLAPSWMHASELTHRATLPRVSRAPELDAFFPAADLLEHATTTMKALGFDLASLPVRLDLEPRPFKRDGCVASSASDVRVSVQPTGGVGDYERLMAGLGCALASAHGEAGVPALDEPSTAEIFSALFARLVASPAWLALEMRLEEPVITMVVRSRAFVRLAQVRDHAARLLEDGADSLEALPLRAHTIAAQLERQLVERYGEAWWTHSEAGAHLRALWREASTRGVAAVMAGEPSPEPFLIATARAFARSEVLAGGSRPLAQPR